MLETFKIWGYYNTVRKLCQLIKSANHLQNVYNYGRTFQYSQTLIYTVNRPYACNGLLFKEVYL